jgi:hypothetical protein
VIFDAAEGHRLMRAIVKDLPKPPTLPSVSPEPGAALLGDSTLVPWYPSLNAPRAGGAYDSHHRTAAIAGRTRRRGGGVAAARGAGAAAGYAGDRISSAVEG